MDLGRAGKGECRQNGDGHNESRCSAEHLGFKFATELPPQHALRRALLTLLVQPFKTASEIA